MPLEKPTKDQLEHRTLVKARERLYDRLQVTFDLIANLPTNEDIFLTRAARSESDFDDFEKVQTNLSRLQEALQPEDHVPIGSVSKSYEDLLFRIQTKANAIRQTQSPSSSREVATGPSVREARGDAFRPKFAPIQIPKFNGDLNKFPAFQSLFDSFVHNTELPEIQKFSLLRNSLEYPALSTVEHFEFTAENYHDAYTRLVKKYTDKRLVGRNILERLLSYKPTNLSTSANLNQFTDVFCVQYKSLKSLGIPDLGDFIITTVALKTLDAETKRLFEEKYSTEQFPKFDNLAGFVEDQCKIVSLSQPTQKSIQPSLSHFNQKSSPKFRKSHQSNQLVTKSFLANSQATSPTNTSPLRPERPKVTRLQCPICRHDHKIYGCPEFLALSITRRIDRIKSSNLCFSCLGNHARSTCTSKFCCRKCNGKTHHTLLHREGDSSPNPTSPSRASEDRLQPSGNSSPSVNVLKSHINQVNSGPTASQGLLGTARGKIQSTSGEWVPCRIIIDPASESSFITEDMVQSLKLPRKPFPVDIVGVGDSRFSNHRGRVECRVAPLHQNKPKLSVEAIILNSISSHIPKSQLPMDLRERFSNLQLADPDFDTPGRIDLLIGVQHYSEILGNHVTHIAGEPAALSSVFGFLIFGKVPTSSDTPIVSTFLTHTPPLEVLLKRFWEIEEPKSITNSDPQHEECEKHFLGTIRRDITGRFEVSLPFIHGKPPSNLGSTRDIARKRLLSVERRLERNPSLREGYNENLLDYLAQGHMRLSPSRSDYIMTHHAVFRDSTSTKVRVVFNASELSDTLHSLNQFLAIGPKLQTDIADILLKFRFHEIAFTADLAKMFRCIRLNLDDARFTHIFWRAKNTDPIQEWELTTLPFGLRCSPYLAQRTIQQLVTEEGDKSPFAAETLTEDIYVDDIVRSVPTVKTAIQLYSQLDQLLTSGGFALHKVSSNSVDVLSQIPSSKRGTSVSFDHSEFVKLLGLKWDPLSDSFCYDVRAEAPISTKRGILSQVARIFDIMGYLAPVTFWIKHLIQRLWTLGVGWDDALPTDLSQAWHEFHTQLPTLADIRIPRPLNISRPADYSILGFSDASEKGYAACAYLRIQLSESDVRTHLLKAKSKVAPLKPLTIPRLELEGAVLLSALLQSIQSLVSQLPSAPLFCFTDSSVVLAWLRTPPYQLKTFVANRVARIIETIPADKWRHVDGVHNPADVASRGLFPQTLIDNTLWWEGPSFTKTPISTWPTSVDPSIDEVPERKSQTHALLTSGKPLEPPDDIVTTLLTNSSSLSRAQRILSYVRRFIQNLRHDVETRNHGPLSQLELQNALDLLISTTQHIHLRETFKDLERGRQPKGFVKHLTPFVCPQGILRVGGRLTYAPLPETQKHPVLLPRQSRLTQLVCEYYHKITLHGGPQLMQSLIQRNFWIPGIRSFLRNFTFKCATCYRFKAKPLEPFMSSLPSVRFKQIRAFVNTGVDLAGPYLIKENKRRNARQSKAWMILFICMTTRAVYLDLVEDISTPTFLAALDRFIARRGIPEQLWSDMGTNFVGAARMLAEPMKAIHHESELIKHYCDERKIRWKFNPPAAPHFGGSWEAAIKSTKHHLKRVVGNLTLTLPEFLTLLAKIEAILNSRPLCPMSSNPSDGFDYLTPGHFLVGAPLLLSRPEEDHLDEPPSFNARWTLISRCAQDFWKRWSTEYLHTLMQRTKWGRRTPNIQTGDLVLLIDSSLPPNLWKMGRILEGIPGPDGIIRVAKLTTATGTLTRPLTKLCLFPPPSATDEAASNEGRRLRSDTTTTGS